MGARKTGTPLPFYERAEGLVMERVLLEQRRVWFGGRIWRTPEAYWCAETEGEMVLLVDADPGAADAMIAEARRQRAFVAVTPFSRPDDLALRLQRSAFRRVQTQGTYVFRPGLVPSPSSPRRRLGLSLWPVPPSLDLEIVPIELHDLARWNRTCWRAFMPRGLSELESMYEKTRAFRNMGEMARWYLASHRGQPVGTAILHQCEGAAILMAVGTDPRWRGRGIGSALVRRAIADHTAHGQGFLFLDTQPGGNAERLYLRLGFVPAYVREVWGT